MDHDAYSYSNDDFSADYDDFSTDDFSADDFSTDFSGADDFSTDFSGADDFSTEAFSFADDDFITPLEPTERITSCYADCTYPGMTMPPAEWGEEEFCIFYDQSTTCNKSSVSSFSCVPSCLLDCSDVFCDTLSAMVFGCDASSHGSYKEKTAVESACLDSFATKTPTKTQMMFTALSELDGVSPSELNNTESKNALIAAMALAMSGVAADDITIVSMTASGGRRLNIIPKHPTIGVRKPAFVPIQAKAETVSVQAKAEAVSIQAISTIVVYQIAVVLEALGFSDTSSSTAYTQLVAQISNSITTGKFQTDLKTAGAAAGVTTFQAVSVTKIPTFTPAQVIYVTTNAPSPASSSAPSPAPSPASQQKGTDDDNNQIGAIVGGVVGGFVSLLALVGVAYFYLSRIQGAVAAFTGNKFRSVIPV
jgi:hypothetical protein